MNIHWICFLIIINVVQSFEDHVRWMYEHRPDEVFTARNSEVIQDPKSRMCYRKFFVNIGKNKYEEHFLPTECDSRILTPAAPWARKMGFIPPKTRVKPLIFHHRIARELPNQETGFIKQIIKQFVNTSKRIERRVQRNHRSNGAYKLN